MGKLTIPLSLLFPQVFAETGTSAFAGDLITNYLPQVAFPIIYFTYKFIKRTKIVKKEDMDFYTNIAEIEAETYEEPKPKNKVQAFFQWLL
jgi:amino acid permease